MKEKTKHRSFFGIAGGAALAAGAVAAGAGKVEAKPRVKRPKTELLSIGAIALGENSHLNHSIWTPTINQTEPDQWPVGRTTGMQITYCWDPKPEVAAEFARKHKCKEVKNYYDMIGKVDGMIFGGFNEVKWWPQLTKPYLEAGIPCHINRPFAYSMKDAKTIVENSKKYNAPILCTDEREYIREAFAARAHVEQLLKDGKTILGGTSDNSAGNEYPQHGVHGLYYMLAVFGLDVEEVSYQADGWWREKTSVVDHPMQYGLLSLRYRGINFEGVPEQTKPFVVTQQQLSGFGTGSCNLRIYYNGGWEDFDSNYRGGAERWTLIYHLFFPTVLAMQRMFMTREMQWSHEYILKKTRIFLAGFKSHLEHKGAMVKVDDLPDDWEAPCPKPDWIDESIFA